MAAARKGIPRKAPRTIRTDNARKTKFLEALSKGASVWKACVHSKLPKRTAYDWREADESFATAWDNAIEAGTDGLEDEAHRRAHDGVKRPVFYKGERIAHVTEYSDQLLMCILRARRPEKYRENVKLEVSGAIDLAARVRRAKERGA